MQAAILEGGDAILALISGNSRTDAATLFAVYRTAYRGRLLEVLANDYPLTRRYAGREEFDGLAHAFIAKHPSQTPNARWFGAAFPAFVASTAHSARHLALSEIAGIEKALADAFDGADGAALNLAHLVQIPPHDWTRLTFTPHVTSSRLTVRTNAFDIWMALKDNLEAQAACLSAECANLIVWRQEHRPLIRPMPYEESMMWTEAAKGVPFGILCEMLATFGDPDTAPGRAAGYLQGWLVSGMLESVTVEPAKPNARQITVQA